MQLDSNEKEYAVNRLFETIHFGRASQFQATPIVTFSVFNLQ